MSAIRNAFKAMYSSINPSFYREIAYQPLKRSLGYLFILLLTAALIVGIKSGLNTRKKLISFSGEAAGFLSEMVYSGLTEIKIENGQLSSPVKQPHVFSKDGVAFILNTAGSIDSIGDNYANAVLLAKHKVIFKITRENGMVEFREMDLRENKNLSLLMKAGSGEKGNILDLDLGRKTFHVSGASLLHAAKKLSFWLFPILFMFEFVLGLLGKVFQVLFFSLISLTTNALANTGLRYSQLINVGIYAITPPTVMSVIWIIFFSGNRAFMITWPLFYVLFYIILLILAVVNLRQKEARP